MKTLYTAEVVSQGGRTGTVESVDGNIDMELGSPAELGGSDEMGPNPEELFAAAYAACFNSALQNAAKRAHMTLNGGTTITALISLNEDDKGGYELGAELRASLPGMDRQEAEKLIEQAHQTCPYSKALRNNVDVKLMVD